MAGVEIYSTDPAEIQRVHDEPQQEVEDLEVENLALFSLFMRELAKEMRSQAVSLDGSGLISALTLRKTAHWHKE